MTRIAGFGSPLLLGFDEMERLVERAAKIGNDGYPPYNIERVRASDGRGEIIRITLAVAGFRENDLDVTVEERQLIVRGEARDDGAERLFLHRGIAARRFQRAFVLAEGIDVVAARLDHGLLEIDLVRPEPERVVKSIRIASRG